MPEEGRVRVLSRWHATFLSEKNPHPSPLPEYRERGQEEYRERGQAQSGETAIVVPSGQSTARFCYWCAFAALALGLLSKPTVVTLPMLFLLLDYWPLRRWMIDE